MANSQLSEYNVFSPNVIEFVTVTAETCLLIDKTEETERDIYIDKLLKILPLLYLKASLVEIPEVIFDEEPMRFVTEDDYIQIKAKIEQLLGADDSYLEVFHPDMPYSDTPVAAFVSEDIADIYQELMDFASNYQTADTDVMNDALAACMNAFREHWGRKLLNALRALHNVCYAVDQTIDNDEIPNSNFSKGKNRSSIFGYLDEQDNDDLDNLLK